MKAIRPVIVALSLLLLLPMFSGCRKYPEGPSISFRSKAERVANNWRANFVFRNNIDETVRYDNYEFRFDRNGEFTWTVTFEGLDPFSLSGTWELATVDEEIKLTYNDPAAAEERYLYLQILKLYEDDLWVSFISEGDQYDLKLLPL